MKNVYDILVNFKKIPYEFYEWEQDDDIIHVKKAPSFKVDDLTIYEFMNYSFNISKEFMELIKDKTEVFANRSIKKVPYSCIVFNDETSLALMFDETGKVVGKSKLLFDESDDVVLSGADLKKYKIEYNVLKKNNDNLKFTRKESKVVMLLLKYLEKTYEDKKSDELKYMYFECFNKEENDLFNAYAKLKQSLENADFSVIDKLKSLVKVLKK